MQGEEFSEKPVENVFFFAISVFLDHEDILWTRFVAFN